MLEQNFSSTFSIQRRLTVLAAGALCYVPAVASVNSYSAAFSNITDNFIPRNRAAAFSQMKHQIANALNHDAILVLDFHDWRIAVLLFAFCVLSTGLLTRVKNGLFPLLLLCWLFSSDVFGQIAVNAIANDQSQLKQKARQYHGS